MQKKLYFVNSDNKYFGVFDTYEKALNGLKEYERNYFNNVDDDEKNDLIFCYKENTKNGTFEEVLDWMIERDAERYFKYDIREIILNDKIQTMEELYYNSIII